MTIYFSNTLNSWRFHLPRKETATLTTNILFVCFFYVSFFPWNHFAFCISLSLLSIDKGLDFLVFIHFIFFHCLLVGLLLLSHCYYCITFGFEFIFCSIFLFSCLQIWWLFFIVVKSTFELILIFLSFVFG